MFDNENKKTSVEQILKEESAKVEQMHSGGPNNASESQSASKNMGNVPILSLIENSIPGGLETIVDLPKKFIFQTLTADLSKDEREVIKGLDESSDTLKKIKVGLLRTLLEDYGPRLQLDPRVAYLAIEAIDIAPMAYQLTKMRKDLKAIDAHVEKKKGE